MTTEEQTLTPVDVEAITAGGAAIRAWLKATYPDLEPTIFNGDCEAMAQAALDASQQVYRAAEEAEAERLVAETGLASMQVEDGAAALRLVLAHDLAVKMTTAFQTILDANPGATNYVEQEFYPRGSRDPYVFVVCKPAGKTPHQLRREAEDQAKRLADDLDRVAGADSELDRLQTALTELAADFRKGSRVVSREFAAGMIERIVGEGAQR